MLSDQNHCCAICGAHQSTFNKSLNVDHCHTTNKVRGLVCTNCNRAIGLIKDSRSIAQSIVNYLSRYEDNNEDL